MMPRRRSHVASQTAWLLLLALGLAGSLGIPIRAARAQKQWVAAATVASPVSGQKRVALIIGNTHYGGLHALKNPENDARAMAAALGKLGFTSIVVLDADRSTMRDTIHDFADRIRAAGPSLVALLFYSGHGMQVDGENYLIPIGFAMPAHKEDMGDSAFSAQKVLAEMQDANAQVNIAILDACRDSPFSDTRSLAGKGLAKLETQGMLIAFATAAGKTASDNEAGANGLYTSALLPYLQTPGLKLYEIFKSTAKSVYEASHHEQFPYLYDGMIDDADFYLLPPLHGRHGDKAPAPANPLPPPIAADPRVDLQRLRAPRTVAEYRAQMVTVPGGSFLMGSNEEAGNERPVHRVTLSSFTMGRTPVTIAMWKEYCRATGREMPAAPPWGWIDDHPIVNISWSEATAFCRWAGLALPTEAQWEYAFRGGENVRYPWGDTWDANRDITRMVVPANSGGRTAPVIRTDRIYENRFGLLDMLGNVR